MITVEPRHAARPHEALEFSQWHERCIEHLLTQSGLNVQREPEILGKTPDLLATTPSGQQVIIECIARLQDPAHAMQLTETGWHCCDGNIRELHQNIYSRLQHKAEKYREISANAPFVVAMFDASCLNSPDVPLDLALSPYAPTVTRSSDGKITGKLYNTMWTTPDVPAALFELYPHLSGLIYSRWPREHYYLPNPYATNPLQPNPFRFAQVPPLPARYRQPSWQPRPATMPDDYADPPDTWQPQMKRLSKILSQQAQLAI